MINRSEDPEESYPLVLLPKDETDPVLKVFQELQQSTGGSFRCESLGDVTIRRELKVREKAKHYVVGLVFSRFLKSYKEVPLTEERPVYGVRWTLEALQQEAERRRLKVPFATVKGRPPSKYNLSPAASWAKEKLLRRPAQEYEWRTMYEYQASHHELYPTNPHTGSPFTPAQIQHLTVQKLSVAYRAAREKRGKDIAAGISADPALPREPWKHAMLLHQDRELGATKRDWTAFAIHHTGIVRDYLGEKVAFVLAWRDCWILWGLLLPAITGIAVLLYGCGTIGAHVHPDLLPTLLLHNSLSSYHALFVCLWCPLVYYLKWNRMQEALAFRWGVTGHAEGDEHESSAYRGVPIEQRDQGAPSPDLKQQLFTVLRRGLSLLIVIALLSLTVVAALLTMSVRFSLRENFRTTSNLVITIVKSLVNNFFILLLGPIYKWSAYRLTVFGNYMFRSDFERALTWKLFLLDFTNTHLYKFLMIFFKERLMKDGLFGVDGMYCNPCSEDDCRTDLLIHTLMYIALQELRPCMPIAWEWVQARFFRSKLPDPGKELLLQVQKEHDMPKFKLPGMLILGASLGELPCFGKNAPDTTVDREHATLIFITKKMMLFSVVLFYSAACPLAPVLALILESLLSALLVDKHTFTQHRRLAAEPTDGIGILGRIQLVIMVLAVVTNTSILTFMRTSGEKYKLFGSTWDLLNLYQIDISSNPECQGDLSKVTDIGLWQVNLYVVVSFIALVLILVTYLNTTCLGLKIGMRQQLLANRQRLKGGIVEVQRTESNHDQRRTSQLKDIELMDIESTTDLIESGSQSLRRASQSRSSCSRRSTTDLIESGSASSRRASDRTDTNV